LRDTAEAYGAGVPLSLDVSARDSTTVVALSGEIDISTIARLRRTLQDLVDDAPVALAVDMSGVGFMDSSGVAVLVATHRRASQRGVAFTLVRPTTIVAKVLALTGVDQLIPVEPAPAGTAALAG
jgi:anti-anti-sigma factor